MGRASVARVRAEPANRRPSLLKVCVTQCDGVAWEAETPVRELAREMYESDLAKFRARKK